MIISALVLAATGGLVATAAPAAAATVDTSAWYVLLNRHSGKALEVYDRATADGARLTQATRTGQAWQQWQFVDAGDGHYRLRSRHSGKVLDVLNRSTADRATIVQWADVGGTNQQFRLADSTGGYARLLNRNSGKAVDVLDFSTADNASVIQYTDLGGTNQQWQLVRVGAAPDTSAPSTPAGARATELTCTSVRLSWTASTDDVGVAFYDIYHDGQLMTSVAGATVTTVLTVTPGARWGLYVNARDAAGNVSQASATVPITVPQCQTDTQAPTAATGLSATATGTTVSLRWNAATDNVGVTAYEITRNGTPAGSVNGTATNFTDSGLTASTRYEYRVVAVDAQGNRSTPSTPITVTTGAGCTAAICAVTQVATDTDVPWGLAQLPTGEVLYSRRDAFDIVRLDPPTGARTSIGRVPGVQGTDGEGGVMGIAVAATFSTDPWVYIMHTSPTDNRVIRMRYTAGALNGSPQVLVSGIARNKFHNGGRLRFGPDGRLYVATGDGQNGEWAQDRTTLAGKVLRINPDGTIPADNPFGNAVWSYGHRNPQGLAFDSQGRLWEQEFGNSVMDETNLIVRGGNYGWPRCEGTTGNCTDPSFVAPERTYPVAAGSCSGIAIVRDVLYIACLRGARLYRAPITGTDLGSPQQFLNGTYGRLRTVEPSNDGGLWLTTSNLGEKDSVPDNSDERILKVTLSQ
nr:PQQ-dependent sugar dehydrogenase [Actinoplanes xinjiangensis]